jgi:anti-sigma B factor antagonist
LVQTVSRFAFHDSNSGRAERAASLARIRRLTSPTLGAGDGEPSAPDDDEDGVARALTVTVRPDRDVVWIRPVGELDLVSAPDLRRDVRELIDVGFDRLVIDLRGVSFLDLTGLRLLLDLARGAREDGWRLSLIPGGGQMRRLLAVTQTGDQLPLDGLSA